MKNTLNFYELLGVSKNATKEEIKDAYKIQMKKWHPDINKSSDAIDMSSKINEAKEVLLDDVKRRDYDEYLDKKVEESYQRYTNVKKQSNYDNTAYQENTVGKWEYFNEWLKKSDNSMIRKLFGALGVLLESAFVFIIRILIIIFAITCNIISVFIQTLFAYLAPVVGLVLIIFIVLVLSNGLKHTINENKELSRGILICLLIFISSFLLPLLSNLMLSAKTFNYLYNTIDINLFKKCVGYKN